jgi:hypothetical protein
MAREPGCPMLHGSRTLRSPKTGLNLLSEKLAYLKDRVYNALRSVAKRYREPVLMETR